MRLNLVYKFNLRLNDRVFSRVQPSYVERFRELVETFSTDGKVVLHLGAGRIDLEASLRSRSFASQMITLDKSLEDLRSNASTVRVCGDAESLPLPSNSVDLIVAEHVFEHFPRPLVCLRECFRLLRPGAKLIVSGPNGRSYVAVLARLTPLGFRAWVHRRMSDSNGTGVNVFPTFYRFSTPRTMRRLARDAGLRVIKIESFVGAPCYTTWLPVLHLAAIGYHCLLETARPLINTHITSVALFQKPLAC
jgi:ubiquinone/menaquinone biosynthesis C-methylase UbiE